MYSGHSTERPFWINVYSSATVRVEPDMASLRFAVSRLAQNPSEAFGQAREGAQSVQRFLAKAGVSDVVSSRVTLAESFRFAEGEQKFVGYSAKVAFHVQLHDLDRMEELLSGLVEAGANEVRSVEFLTSRLKEIRAEARRKAVEAAHEKAEVYCSAAGVSLGPVIHIQDASSDSLQFSSRHGRVAAGGELEPADDDAQTALSAGSIFVDAAVRVDYEIERE